MLYSESIERQERFKLSLKIAFPLLLVFTLYVFLFINKKFEIKDFILLISFILIYIYYVFYMIYLSFKISSLDNYTKAFNNEGIIKEIENIVRKKDKNGFIAMVSIENIFFIEEQYSASIKNKVLNKFIQKLNIYLEREKFKKIPIGRYQTGTFLLIFDNYKNKVHLKHVLTGFCKDIEKNGINSIELKVSTAIIETSYDNNVKNIISKLINLPNEEELNLNVLVKPDEYDDIIKKAIESQQFIIHYHGVYSFTCKKQIPYFYTTNIKLNIDNFGIVTKNKLMQTINKLGFEINFDINVVKTIFSEIEELIKIDEDIKIIIKISPVTFRNSLFLITLKELLKQYSVKAKNICFSFSEKRLYDDILRFKNIIEEYKNIGFYIIYDEFGINDIGFEYIRKDMKFDMVTCDLDFIKNIDSTNYFEMLKSIVDFLNKIDIKSIVKFVDKPQLKTKLSEINPDFIQGFLYSKPQPINEILKEKIEIR